MFLSMGVAKEVNEAFRGAHAIAEDVKQTGAGCRVVWHAMRVAPGPEGRVDQQLHVDDDGERERSYYTLLMPLTCYEGEGGTWFSALEEVVAPYGGAVVFDGGVLHKGTGNHSEHARVFLYAAIFSGNDEN